MTYADKPVSVTLDGHEWAQAVAALAFIGGRSPGMERYVQTAGKIEQQWLAAHNADKPRHTLDGSCPWCVGPCKVVRHG